MAQAGQRTGKKSGTTEDVDDIRLINMYLIYSSIFPSYVQTKKDEIYINLPDAKIVEVNPATRTFVLKGKPPVLYTAQTRVFFKLTVETNIIEFSTVVYELPDKNSKFVRFMFPKQLRLIYERAYFRIEPISDTQVIANCFFEPNVLITDIKVSDLSLGGAGLEILHQRQPLKIGTIIDAIDLYFPDGTTQIFCGQIRNVFKKKYGVKFIDVDHEAYKSLARYLYEAETAIISRIKSDKAENPLAAPPAPNKDVEPKKPSQAAPTDDKKDIKELKELKKASFLEIDEIRPSYMTDRESPIRLLDFVEIQIDTLFNNVKTEKKYQEMYIEGTLQLKVEEIARIIQNVCTEDEDFALGSILTNQDSPYSVRHPIHTAIVCEIISKYLDWDSGKRLSLLDAALTMNIAMLELQDILHNQKTSLTEKQRELLYNHPTNGANALKILGVNDNTWINTVRLHHEKSDGTGYPSGLKGDEVTRAANILSMSDVYCAIISSRGYKPSLASNTAIKEMFMDIEKNSDNTLSMAFVKNLGIYVPGSAVKLRSNEIGIVIKRGGKIYSPIVYTVVGSDGFPALNPKTRDTGEDEFAIVETIPMGKLNITANRVKLWGYGISGKAKSSKRRHDRTQSNIPAKILDTKNVLTANAVITDISKTGCLVKVSKEINRKFVTGRQYSITFKLLNTVIELTRILIKNRRETLDFDLYGCQFVDIDPGKQNSIGAYLDKVRDTGGF